MIVKFRTGAQAVKAAERCGGVVLPARPRKDGKPGSARHVDVGPDFESVREQVESVTVMFDLFNGDASTWADGFDPGTPVHNGWTFTAAKFEVEWPDDPGAVRSHFGARRKAFNWALGQVKDDLDAKKLDGDHVAVRWDFQSLRNEWNQVKDDVAPWWSENSKESYATGIDDLVTALNNWQASTSGVRKGRRVGFPRFKSARNDRSRVRFTTGAMRLEADRRTIVIPKIGKLRSKENTRRVQRHLVSGRARIFNMTLTEQWGRLFVSVNYALRTPHTDRRPAMPDSVVGVDLGLRDLATTVDSDDNIKVYPNPAPLRATLAERRRFGRQLSRRIPGSRGHEQAKAKLARLDRRAVHIRREAAHQLTTELARTYGTVKIEDLDLAAMKKSMGRRAFRRSVSDAALGAVRPMLEYKAPKFGSTLVVVDRWFPSSQIHHGCGCRLIARKSKLDKMLVCERSGELVDRDVNAACNIRDWTPIQSSGPVRTVAPNGSPEALRASRVVGTADALASAVEELEDGLPILANACSDEARIKTSQEDRVA